MKPFLDTTDPRLYGYIFLAIGIIVRYIIYSRRYKRRGVGGMQHFNTPYASVVLIITFLEWVFKWASYALMLLGIFLIIKW